MEVPDIFMLHYLPELTGDVSWGLLFVFGILTSFHCMGMCGGIVLSQTVGGNGDVKPAGLAVAVPSVLYNTGRIAAYTLIGGIAGGLGHAVSLTGVWRGLIPVLAGVFMILLAVNLLGIFPVLRHLNMGLPKGLAKRVYDGTHKKAGAGRFHPLAVGLLSGLMPCGPMQMVQVYALSTGSVFYGALSMFIFSAGTVPLLFAFGFLNTFVNKRHTAWILRTSAILVLVLGFLMAGRGLALAGINVGMPYGVQHTSAEAGKKAAAKAAVKDPAREPAVQMIDTELSSGAFPDITVQRGIKVKWVLHAKKENLNDCNSAIVIPKLNVEWKLGEGDNVLKFLPQEEGVIPYTCWMGMINGKITVVENKK